MTTVSSTGITKILDIQEVVAGTASVLLSESIPLDDLSKLNLGGQLKSQNIGLQYRIFTGYFADDVTWFNSKTDANIGLTSNFTSLSTATGGIYTNTASSTTFSVEWIGYFYAPTSGPYIFYIKSYDITYMWVGTIALEYYNRSNCLMIKNDTIDRVSECSVTTSLTGGTYYPIRIQYGQKASSYDFTVSFSGPNITRTYDCTGYMYYGIETNQPFPVQTARLPRTVTATNTYNIIPVISNRHWGNPLWTLLHTITVVDNSDPAIQLRDSMRVIEILRNIHMIIPCHKCAAHYQEFFQTEIEGQDLHRRMELFDLLVDFHNQINKKLGKPIKTLDEARLLWTKPI